MKVSERWLREFVDPPCGTDGLVDQLTMQGLEVDAVGRPGDEIAGVVAGRVLALEPHPQADRLRVCQVDAGGGTPLQIVCGAANVQAGGLYPVAMVGARLPDGTVIKAARLRGVESAGMLCSARELGLDDTADGLLELDATSTPGTTVTSLLGLPDSVLDLNITPNRADCFGMIGIARDVAAVAGMPWSEPQAASVPATTTDAWPARVSAPADCGTFALRVITGVDNRRASPLWLRQRLQRAGIRSISPVVDITNYVLLERGQPLHAYDRASLSGALTVRRASQGERLTAIGGQELELDPSILVIADQRSAVGVAGIIGGAASSCGPGTTDIVLESAGFVPAAIAGRARGLGLQTDASQRFERGVDPTGQVAALERATALIIDLAGGSAGPVVVAGEGASGRGRIELRRSRLAAVLGCDIADEDVEGILVRLGLGPIAMIGGWRVNVPGWRFDLEREVDLIEEVARVHGYARIPARPQVLPVHPGRAPEGRLGASTLRNRFAARGYHEVITYSFTAPDLDRLLTGTNGPRLANPISSELAVLRGSTWPGLIQVLRHNLARQQERVRIFELGRRYREGPGGVVETAVCGALLYGPVLPEQWAARDRGRADFFDIKADLEAVLAGTGRMRFEAAQHPALHPGQSARIHRGDEAVGWAGALHPVAQRTLDLVQSPILVEFDLEPALRRSPAPREPVPRFPAVRRDLALEVPLDVPAAALVTAVQASGGDVLHEVRVFDIYAGSQVEAGRKSVALGLILQDSSRTLTDADVDGVVRSVVRRLGQDFAARVRE